MLADLLAYVYRIRAYVLPRSRQSDGEHYDTCVSNSHYDAGNDGGPIRSVILSFAEFGLLGSMSHPDENEDGFPMSSLDRTLACFSVHVPLELKFADPAVHTLVRKQVEHHMRLCTTVTSGFEKLFCSQQSIPGRYLPRPPKPGHGESCGTAAGFHGCRPHRLGPAW